MLLRRILRRPSFSPPFSQQALHPFFISFRISNPIFNFTNFNFNFNLTSFLNKPLRLFKKKKRKQNLNYYSNYSRIFYLNVEKEKSLLLSPFEGRRRGRKVAKGLLTTPPKAAPPPTPPTRSKHGSRGTECLLHTGFSLSLYTRNTYLTLFIRESRYIHPPGSGSPPVWTLPKKLRAATLSECFDPLFLRAIDMFASFSRVTGLLFSFIRTIYRSDWKRAQIELELVIKNIEKVIKSWII